MCGIAGILDLQGQSRPKLERQLQVMNTLQAHRGPDGEGCWRHPREFVGLGHRRLSIIDLDQGAQPMRDEAGNVISFNGEIYNYLELREELGAEGFRTSSDTEVILAAYRKWGRDCLERLRGMFAFALWDEARGELFCARDRCGVKPFYYTVVDDVLYLSSEAKALLPFLSKIEPDPYALRDYLTFQLCLEGKTLFWGVRELLPGHQLVARPGAGVRIERYWNVFYELDLDHTNKYFRDQLQGLIEDAVRLHLRADVPVGAYVSGGIDSGIVASIAARSQPAGDFLGFTGKFGEGPQFDESEYARALASWRGFDLHEVEITSRDFVESIAQVIYHLDYPVAGPGSFPQFHVSKLASQHLKVVLGGQGGDEVFGGYARYLIAYFEQCIRGAIDGTMHDGNFVVTYESIIPNLAALRNYKPLLQKLWRDGLFDELDRRYYRLIDRADSLGPEVRWDELPRDYDAFATFSEVFHGDNVEASYFDSMTHFDFKTLLPGLLHVEDRMSMAHGLESRVPLLDHPLVEFAARVPAKVKFEAGTLKRLLLDSMRHELPAAIAERKDKMGFPVPLHDWIAGDLRDFLGDTFSSPQAAQRRYLDRDAILAGLDSEVRFGRKVWGLLSLELWHQTFCDRQAHYQSLLDH